MDLRLRGLGLGLYRLGLDGRPDGVGLGSPRLGGEGLNGLNGLRPGGETVGDLRPGGLNCLSCLLPTGEGLGDLHLGGEGLRCGGEELNRLGGLRLGGEGLGSLWRVGLGLLVLELRDFW